MTTCTSRMLLSMLSVPSTDLAGHGALLRGSLIESKRTRAEALF